MANDLTAQIRSNPMFDESVHSALIEVIQKKYSSPEQLSVMQDDPVVLDSLIRGMLSAMLTPVSLGLDEAAARNNRLRQAEELMRKSWAFLNERAQHKEDARVELRAA